MFLMYGLGNVVLQFLVKIVEEEDECEISRVCFIED